MKDVTERLERTLTSSLKRYIDVRRPLLLALSGGSDSMALLGLLLEQVKSSKSLLSFSAVYIDHQWRPESQQEAQGLRRYTENLGIPLVIHQLDEEPFNEEAARKGRLRCFRMLMQQTGSQAVCLAHHRDDQEETLIKRLFEGAGLIHLQGMQEFSQRDDGLCLWRPLLSHRKEELLCYLKEKQMPYWKDCTNDDPRFLRVRMRQSLLPLLSEHFGKEIGTSLHHLSSEAQQLEEYLEARIQENLPCVHRGPLGVFWEWPNGLPNPYVLRYYLRQALKACGMTLSREEVERTQKALSEKRVYYQIRNAQKMLFADRERLFLLEGERQGEEVKRQQIEAWRIQRQEPCKADDSAATDWQSGWSGRWNVHLPPGEEGCYTIRMPTREDRMWWRGKWVHCHEVWRNCRVPEPLRERFPVVVRDSTEVVAQFLVRQPQQASDAVNRELWTLQPSE